MPKMVDLVGQRFGQLTVIERAHGEHKRYGILWRCACDCGNESFVLSNSLRRGLTTNCGTHRIVDLTNKRFGKLTAVRLCGRTKQGRAKWLCKCDCGNERIIAAGSLVQGLTTSCGCVNQAQKTKHGMYKSSEYSSWYHMKARCCDPNNTKYIHYGGRGITVCDRWVESFENFLADMGPKPTQKHSIDRIDVNGNYEPSNCRWATIKEQNGNIRRQLRKKVVQYGL